MRSTILFGVSLGLSMACGGSDADTSAAASVSPSETVPSNASNVSPGSGIGGAPNSGPGPDGVGPDDSPLNPVEPDGVGGDSAVGGNGSGSSTPVPSTTPPGLPGMGGTPGNEPSGPQPEPNNSGGNAGSGNAGSGNAGSGNAGSGNAGSGNAGSGNAGSGNAGSGGAPVSVGATPVERHGQLHVDGNRLVDKNGLPVTLRGQGFGWDNWWPQYYNADVVSWLRDDWCVDMVRPAMGIEPEGAYLENPDASRSRIQAVVDAAIARGVYVIIDWHAHDMHQNEAIAFFSQMAETYGSQAAVIYEVFNEPEGETWPEVKAYAEAVIAAIRQHDPDNLVIVGSPEWDQRIDLVAADPITSDDNVIYSVHFYAATHDQWLRDRAAAALEDGIPLLVSESSGSEAAGTGANNYGEWEAWFDFMDQNQISWINYSVSDKAGETISVLEPGAPANGGWNASQLTETGEYIRDVLRTNCRY